VTMDSRIFVPNAGQSLRTYEDPGGPVSIKGM